VIPVTGRERDVVRLLNPRSVAVIGASSRPGALSWWPLHLLRQYQFAGAIFPVNPNRSEIDGVPCVSGLAAIGGPVDVAVVALNAENTLAAVHECAAAGVGAVVLPAQGFGELGEPGRAAERAMVEAARGAGMRIVGPNTDGVANIAAGAVLSIQPLFGEQMSPGPVAVITQSGASAGSLLARLRREGIGARYYASAGNEIDLGLADYLSVAVQDPEVRMVLSFVEAIRRPADFVAVARLASELGKPIVLIKVGRTVQAAARAAAHTGALAGEDRIYEALFRSLGVIRLNELGEIVALAKYYLAHGVPRSAGVGLMSVSGGQAGALADLAVQAGLDIAPIQPDTSRKLAELLPFGSPLNPADLTGEIATRETLAADVFGALASDPSLDTIVYARKELTGQAGRLAARHLAQTAAGSSAALVVYAMDGDVNDDERATYRSHNVPVFTSAAEMYTAIRGLLSFGTRAKASPPAETRAPAAALPAPDDGRVLGQQATASLLRAYGIDVLRDGLATSPDEAVALARQFGYPAVLKVVSARIPHKTEMGGVLLGVDTADAVRSGFDLLMRRGRAALDGADPDGVLIQQQVTDGVEMIAGLVTDPQFGPFVLLGTGGVAAELLDDVVLRPAPVEESEVAEMIAELRGRRLLDGFRGAPAADVAALAATVAALSRLGADHAGGIAEMDLNPVLVRPLGSGAVVPDALVVLADAAAESGPSAEPGPGVAMVHQ
jgi:acyl-CoA synthetase (NDP forming)